MKVCSKHEQAYEGSCPWCEPADGAEMRFTGEALPHKLVYDGYGPQGPGLAGMTCSGCEAMNCSHCNPNFAADMASIGARQAAIQSMFRPVPLLAFAPDDDESDDDDPVCW